MRVAIIGAGPGGLAAARYLYAEKAFSAITIFEQRDEVGGVWCHTSEDTIDEDFAIPHTKPTTEAEKPIVTNQANNHVIFQSPVYDLLETNIPHTLMGYSDKKFPKGTPLFPSHRDVKQYLQGYAKDLSSIMFHTQVVDVCLRDENAANATWLVSVQDLRTHYLSTHEFDAVVVASGHYSDHYIPDIVGMREWNTAYPHSISHSKHYKRPEHFTNQKVVVVGNSASGVDVSVQIATVSKKPLLLSERSDSPVYLRDNHRIRTVPEIIEFITRDRALRFADGHIEKDIDHVLFCTGYLYSFPFLSSLSPPVEVPNGSRPDHLFQHIFYYPQPTLTFIGLPLKIIPFPLSEGQAAVIARAYSGRLSLPPLEEMKAWEADWIARHGSDKSFSVLGFPADAEYLNHLHHWSLQARRKDGLENDGQGKIPPVWGDEEQWLRELTPTIKAASQALGNKRKEIRTLEELGFSYAKDGKSKL
ncbi:flavin dependent monooxygenase, putative [Talaromyces stipitatus ATCC 10500]|uniref:Flavin dependent monooxygenase, putative n=1 Tax=Talaromyces stipitatus (strain ATCC 10500 / CBS 375.48 / QM 6759 / NRRL 1006) TaxID=441959 RepID=B8M953_TALSN|nr:flavin dependent monooxygenase, putative [Talaromyces stipitatus ATCC 10500]EED17348.1 flavin dependent monooxygenase, putative [Talaromyces stipitatus ATCC 10500]